MPSKKATSTCTKDEQLQLEKEHWDCSSTGVFCAVEQGVSCANKQQSVSIANKQQSESSQLIPADKPESLSPPPDYKKLYKRLTKKYILSSNYSKLKNSSSCKIKKLNDQLNYYKNEKSHVQTTKLRKSDIASSLLRKILQMTNLLC